MAKKAKPSYYAVNEGYRPGVYHTWDACEAQVKGYPGSKYKGFDNYHDALDFAQHGAIGRLPGNNYGNARGEQPHTYTSLWRAEEQVACFPNAPYNGLQTLNEAKEVVVDHADEDMKIDQVPASQSYFSKRENVDFEEKPDMPFQDQFTLLAASQSWSPRDEVYKEQKALALHEEVEKHFFSGVPTRREDGTHITPPERRLLGYQKLCRWLQKPAHDTIKECQDELNQRPYVNIVDLIDTMRTGRQMELFDDLDDLRKYTMGTPGKCIPLSIASRYDLLRPFLQNFTNGPRSRPERRPAYASSSNNGTARVLQENPSRHNVRNKQANDRVRDGKVQKSPLPQRDTISRWGSCEALMAQLEQITTRMMHEHDTVELKLAAADTILGMKKKRNNTAAQFAHQLVERTLETKNERSSQPNVQPEPAGRTTPTIKQEAGSTPVQMAEPQITESDTTKVQQDEEWLREEGSKPHSIVDSMKQEPGDVEAKKASNEIITEMRQSHSTVEAEKAESFVSTTTRRMEERSTSDVQIAEPSEQSAPTTKQEPSTPTVPNVEQPVGRSTRVKRAPATPSGVQKTQRPSKKPTSIKQERIDRYFSAL